MVMVLNPAPPPKPPEIPPVADRAWLASAHQSLGMFRGAFILAGLGIVGLGLYLLLAVMAPGPGWMTIIAGFLCLCASEVAIIAARACVAAAWALRAPDQPKT